MTFRKGAKVEWKWAGGVISGVVEEVYKKSITKTIKGKKITRHGSEEKPAYLVRSEAGNIALKLVTELHAPQKSKRPQPQFNVSQLKSALAIFAFLFLSYPKPAAAQQNLPIISSEQMQLGHQWIWEYYESGDLNKLYSTERYTVTKRNGDIVTLDLWTKLAASREFTPSARFIVNLNDCWSAFKTKIKREFQITIHSVQNNKWSTQGYSIPSTAFEEKFNCNPYNYASEGERFRTNFSDENTPYGLQRTFQQEPMRKGSQLYSYYFADHPALKGVAYRKRFNPLSPYEFEMRLSHFETDFFSPRP